VLGAHEAKMGFWTYPAFVPLGGACLCDYSGTATVRKSGPRLLFDDRTPCNLIIIAILLLLMETARVIMSLVVSVPIVFTADIRF